MLEISSSSRKKERESESTVYFNQPFNDRKVCGACSRAPGLLRRAFYLRHHTGSGERLVADLRSEGPSAISLFSALLGFVSIKPKTPARLSRA